MKSKYLISVKSSGLCFNIMRLIILTKVAQDFGRKFIFLTKPDHIPILKKFNKDCIFISYVDNHTKHYNNFTRKKNIHIVYDLKYINFLKSTYLNSILGNLKINEYDFISGCLYDIKNNKDKHLIVDYNDGLYDSQILNSITIPPHIVDKSYLKFSKDILSINIKINNPDNSRIYDLWDKIIPLLKKDYKKSIFLISGNNNIKKYLGKKHNCMYDILETETNFSNVRGNNIIRGKALEIYKDLILCTSTHFIPFIELRKKYSSILNEYNDLNFVVEKEEKFDILAEYLSKHITIQEP